MSNICYARYCIYQTMDIRDLIVVFKEFNYIILTLVLDTIFWNKICTLIGKTKLLVEWFIPILYWMNDFIHDVIKHITSKVWFKVLLLPMCHKNIVISTKTLENYFKIKSTKVLSKTLRTPREHLGTKRVYRPQVGKHCQNLKIPVSNKL